MTENGGGKSIFFVLLQRMKLRQATAGDRAACWQLIDEARWKMMREGRRQWTPDYPSETLIGEDIALGRAYVLPHDGRPVAYGVLVVNGEPAYGQLAGHWLWEGDYVVIHRLAVSPSAQGLGWARRYLLAAERWATEHAIPCIKIDTNHDNIRMLSMMDSLGYSRRGLIDYGPKGMRIAFEKMLNG